jgi:hypothetical protein
MLPLLVFLLAAVPSTAARPTSSKLTLLVTHAIMGRGFPLDSDGGDCLGLLPLCPPCTAGAARRSALMAQLRSSLAPTRSAGVVSLDAGAYWFGGGHLFATFQVRQVRVGAGAASAGGYGKCGAARRGG